MRLGFAQKAELCSEQSHDKSDGEEEVRWLTHNIIILVLYEAESSLTESGLLTTPIPAHC